MSNRHASPSSLDTGTLVALPENVVGVMQQSFKFITDWNKVKPPSRLAIGGATMRKLSQRVRKQPANFVVIMHQSLKTAEAGENLCKRGSKATRVLLGEEDHPQQATALFVEGTVEEIRSCATQLIESTKGMRSKLRLLRQAILEASLSSFIHKELNAIISKQERPDFLLRLSRFLSGDVSACEKALGDICKDIDKIEETLNLMILWWQQAATQAAQLHTNGASPLVAKGNMIILNELKGGFGKLEQYFDDYSNKVSSVYDQSVALLSEEDNKYLEAVREYANLTLSPKGRLVQANTNLR